MTVFVPPSLPTLITANVMSATAPPMLPGIRDLFPDHLFDAAEAQNNANSRSRAPRRDVPPSSYKSPSISSRSSSSPSSVNISLSTSPGSSISAPRRYPRTSSHERHSSTDSRHSIAEEAATSLVGLSLLDHRKSIGYGSPIHYVHGGRNLHSPTERHSMLDSPLEAMSPTTGLDSVTGIKDGKRHTCPHCGKRFNRPSSLGIHINTHTGVKPFECPFAGCGRQFNVSSNMRRHFRNHTSASSTTATSDGPYTTAHPSTAPGAAPSLPTSNHYGRRPDHGRTLSSESNPAAKRNAYPSSTASFPSPGRSELSLSSDGGDERDLDGFSDSGRRSPPYSYAGGPERTSHVRRSSASSAHSPYPRHQQLRSLPPSGLYSQDPVYTFPPPPPPSAALPVTIPASSGRRYSGAW